MSDIRKPLPPVLEVRVTYSSGTYQTQTVRGQRASSTSPPTCPHRPQAGHRRLT